MKKRIARLSVLQTGKFLAFMCGFLSLISLPFILIPGLVPGQSLTPMLGMLLLYPIMAFIGGIIMAVLYNLVARWIGGIEVTVEVVEGE
jgi:drug/metabolite transporter (DMT)-like permease